MIKAKEISITRAEGRISECGKVHTFVEGEADIWKRANALLIRWSKTAPTVGYDKCDFTITYQDGETYSGRYDLKHYSREIPNLGRHIYDNVRYMAGLWKPSWMSEELYKSAMQQNGKSLETYLKFYQTHDIDGMNKPELVRSINQAIIDDGDQGIG